MEGTAKRVLMGEGKSIRLGRAKPFRPQELIERGGRGGRYGAGYGLGVG